MRKLHAGDILPGKMAQLRASTPGAYVLARDCNRAIILEKWQGGLPVLPEDEVEDRGNVYEHAKEPKYSGKYLGHGG